MKVLVINGGGARGIIPAKVLQYIESKTNKRIYELFDLIVGTSTGGILTYGVTLGEYTPETIINLYRTECKNIFQKRKLPFITSTYKINGLEETLTKYFGQFKLSDCKVKTITTGRDKLNKENLIFKSWSEYWKDLDVKHAAISTAAAPNYFPTYEFLYKNKRRLAWDGGVYAANPSIIAQIEANYLGVEDKDIVMLNLGTGKTKPNGFDSINPNKIKLISEITGDMLDSQSELASYAMKLSLKDNYFYWDVEIPDGQSDMAEYQYMNVWESLTDEKLKTDKSLDKFIENHLI